MKPLPSQHCAECSDDDLKAVAKQAIREDEDWLVVVELECGHEFTFPSGWLDYLT